METKMDQSEGRILRAVVVLAALIVGMMGTVPEASAADDETLALTLVNGADSAGEPVAEKLRRILRAEERVRYVSENDVLDQGRPHGVDVETLRKGSERARHKQEFRKTMRTADIHAILVLDVFSGTAQVVTVGPGGDEVSDRRRSLSGGNLPTKKAGALLKNAFGDLIPEWKAWKKRRDRQAEQSSSDDTSSTAAAGGTQAPGDSSSATSSRSASTGTAAGGRRHNPGGLDGGVRIWIGGIAGRHSLTAQEKNGSYDLTQANPFLGGRAEVTAMLGRFKHDTVGIALKLFGSYAPFEIVFQNDDEASEKLASDLTQAGVDLVYMRQLSNRLRFEFGTGFEALSLRVSSNPNYTGNRYAQFRFTGGLRYQVLSSLNLQAGGGLAPIIESDMSGGAMGDSQFAPAVLANGAVELTAFDPVMISVRYDIYHYDLVFRTPFLANNPIGVTDTYQFGGLRFSYAF